MKIIIIKKNENYLKRIIVIIILFFILYQLIVFLQFPNKHKYFLLPTVNSVIVFSFFGILIILLALYFIFRNIFRKNIFLQIDNKGIYNSFFIYDKKSIKWEEIKKIETINYNYSKYIAIFLKETPNNEKGINSLFFKINQKTMGTPYFINSEDLNCSFFELEKIIFENYEFYKIF